jgi:hypothetical protein
VASSALTDDRRAPLFSARDLAPGRSVAGCLRVTYTGSTAGTVRLTAEDVAGALVADLRVEVAVGTTGSGPGCAGFTGTTVYRGSLTDLGGVHGGKPGVSTRWRPAAGDRRTYRITLTVADTATAQGASATATLRWLLDPGADPPFDPPPAPTTDPLRSPATGGGSPPAPPAPTGNGTAGAPGRSAPPAEADGRRHHANDGFTARLSDLTATIADVAARTARHGGIPVASGLVALLFLLVQNRIDARDPKLCRAPLWSDPHLHFPDEEPDLPHDERGEQR